MRRGAFSLVLAAVLGMAVLAPARAADTPVDLELILAVDVSRSMDIDEQKLQRDGYVGGDQSSRSHRRHYPGAPWQDRALLCRMGGTGYAIHGGGLAGDRWRGIGRGLRRRTRAGADPALSRHLDRQQPRIRRTAFRQ